MKKYKKDNDLKEKNKTTKQFKIFFFSKVTKNDHTHKMYSRNLLVLRF